MWVSLPNQLKAWIEQKTYPKQEGILPPDDLWTSSATSALPGLLAEPVDLDCNCFLSLQSASLPHQILDLPSLQNGVSQFLKINLFHYIYTFYLFCFSGVPRLIQAHTSTSPSWRMILGADIRKYSSSLTKRRLEDSKPGPGAEASVQQLSKHSWWRAMGKNEAFNLQRGIQRCSGLV